MRLACRFIGLVAMVLVLSMISTALAQGPPEYVPGQLIVKFKSTAGKAGGDVLRQINATSRQRFELTGAEVIDLHGISVEDAIDRLRRDPAVEYAEPNWVLHALLVPNDPRFPELYGMRNTGQTGGTAGADIKATQAWDLYTGDANLLVGVIDTGVDYTHPDLAANIWTNPGEIPGNGIDDDLNTYVDDVHGYDFVNNDGDPLDDHGHGTHVSGTIAGHGNNATGVVGVVWRAKIVGMKFLNSSGSGSTTGAIAAVQYATRLTQAGHNLRLTSNSWGGGGFSQALLDAINAAGAAGQLFVAAAGNSGQNTDTTPSYPASYNTPYIIAVAATDHNDNLASFSNYGATTVDLAAPGVNILSTLPGNAYGSLSGTSMATPHTAGAVALTWGRFPALGNLQVKNLLLNAVDVKPQLAGKVLTNGRLNAFMAIAEPDSTAPGAITNLATSDAASNSIRLTWTATGDDGNTGRAVRYEVRYSTAPITAANFSSAALAPSGDPLPAGSAETLEVGGLDFLTTYYFAVKAFDEFANAGPLSNVPDGTTLGIPDLAASPSSFAATLLTGATETQTLMLSNTAAGTLDWSLPTPQILFSQPAIYPPETIAKGDVDPRPGILGSGGPDGFGYRWIDSDDPSGPSFAWEDITGVGTQITLTGDDATSAAIPMGMSFPFYGNSFSSVRVCTNGFLSFTDASSAYGNQPLPTTGAPANLVAPFWSDLDFGATPRAYYHNDGSKFIVSWVAVPKYGGGGPYTFQALLYPTGEVRVQYLTLGAPTNVATTGIQNATKDIGLMVAFNSAYLHDNLAVRMIPLSQWLTVTPTSGRILAGQNANIDVRFNALGLDGGDYSAHLHVLSNDPDESDVELPASLHVIGAPDLAVAPAALAYGDVFVGATPTRSFVVSNPGTDDLVVSGLVSSDATLSTDATTPFTLGPREALTVVVTWSPASIYAMNATLTLQSNDPDSPNTVVTVTGNAVAAPSFSVDPTSFDVSLLSNTSTTRNLRISNSGGSNYVFTAEAMVEALSGTVHVYGDEDNVELEKDQPDVQSGPAAQRAGGPDVFGYTYSDSDEPGGPSFGWVDISGVGTLMTMTGDDSNTGPYPIGFAFPYYGNTFTTFRACTNGFISFTSTRTNFTNTALPNSGSTIPENLLAAFWDDLHFGTANRCYYYNDGTRLIVQWHQVPRRSETPPNTFQIILYPNGTIVYQYLSMQTATKNSCTIGIQNQAKNDGLQVVFNATYVKNNLAIRFAPPARFLTVSPGSGTVPPGGFVDLTVGFNAADLFGGDYNGAVHITGNDPVIPQLDVPAVLHVTGMPDIAVTPGSLDFGEVFIGYPKVLQLSVQNDGTDALNVSNVTSTDAAYGVDPTVFSIPPLSSQVLNVSFSPPDAAAHPAMLTIHSNDPDTAMLSVGLAGTGLVPPDVSTTPTSLSSTLDIPDSEVQTLTVHNTGGSDLDFTVGAQITASAVEVYGDIELGKDDADPRPGLLGSGGPDAFGYTWRDSDDPGGPSFAWVDITGVGTPIALNGDDQNLGPFVLPFAFPFYGNTFNSFRVVSNGWLSFTSTSTDYSNDPLPNTGAPENLLAVFWDDLDFRPTSGSAQAFSHYDGTRLIVSYVNVPHYTTTGTGLYTFQVILYPNGRIVYQYLDMQGTLNSATIGIQNAAKNDGLMAVHNNTYVHNNLAIEFRTLPEWVAVSPNAGTIPAGGSMDLQVTFDSTDLFAGDYNGAVRIASNDPDEGLVTVPAVLHALGVPHIGATPASLDFGWLYLSQTRDVVVQLVNVGTDVLQVTGGFIDNPAFSLVSGSFPVTLGDGGVAAFTLRFAPTEACNPCTGNFVVSSNDPDAPTFAVPLTGIGLVPPEIEVDPTSLRAALATTLGPTAISKTKTLLLRNTGGSDLNWSAAALPSAAFGALGEPQNEEGPKDDPGTPGEPVLQGSGGPDAYGYKWLDSDGGGPAIDWVDITGVGTPIPFTGDDQNQGPFPLPFPFEFYGNTFTEFRVCTNGWVSFTSNKTTFTNAALPNTGSTVPENLIALFWDDLTFTSAGDAYYYYDGLKFIVSYVGVPRLGTGGGLYTFQILLWPNGTIDLQYLTMAGTRLNEATIGIQNAARDIGLTVVHNAAYMHDDLRIRISRTPDWLSVTPESGVVPAGGEVPLQVGFDATGLEDGDYSGSLRIASNDLDEPILVVPCDLHVGVVAADLTVDPNTLNRNSSGNWVHTTVELGVGHDAHDILTSSLLLQHQVPWAPDSPVTFTDNDSDGLPEGNYKFDRLSLSSLLPTGGSITVDILGEEEDVTWFTGTTTIRVLKPKPKVIVKAGDPAQPAIVTREAGSVLALSWDDAEGARPSHYELWYSADKGSSWTMVDGRIQSRDYDWTLPTEETEEALFELVAVDDLGPMGAWISDPFVIAKGATTAALPTEFGLRLAGTNPTRGAAQIALAIPQAGVVDLKVYDVKGGLVKQVVQQAFSPGWHRLAWDGRDSAGRSVAAGIYFLRMTAGERVQTARVVLMR